MAMQGGEHVYATLLLTDSYLPGALVLAHSLRDAGTTKKLAVLVTLDSVSAEVITQLKTVYDYVIPVSRIQNQKPANLHLMDRPDLHSAFTKINLWRLTQFSKIVYIDADIVAYRAPDELFDIPHAFSAAPDIGWPDLFNTGVMVLTPDMGEYYALRAMADRGISFDGADQGLLNMHFKNNYNRISFAYNVTPSAHYQYIPAYRHFQSTVNMAHFIGSDKPWTRGREIDPGDSPFDEMTGRWWAVYDKHYRSEASAPATQPTTQPGTTQVSQPPPEIVQYFVKGEYQPKSSYVVPIGKPHYEHGDTSHGRHQGAPAHHHEPEHHHQDHHSQPHPHHHEQPRTESSGEQPEPQHSVHTDYSQPATTVQSGAQHEQASGQQGWVPPPPQSQPEHKPEPPPPQPAPSWDAQRQPPPPDSKPEALNFPQTHYEMSSDAAPFVPPERYPSPPRDLWYEVPKEPPAAPSQAPKPIFPWESHRPRASRVFPNASPVLEPTEMVEPPIEAPSEREASTDHQNPPDHPPAESHPPELTDALDSSITTASPTSPSDPWSSFPRTNAWDEVPEINRYVGTWEQKHRRTKSRGLKLGTLPPTFTQGYPNRRGSRVTDFPSETERPSLPVTPAPMRRPRLWGGTGPGTTDLEGGDDDEQWLPAAAGVPSQTDWDPVAQLQKLAQEQSELLLRKLGGGAEDGDDGAPGLSGSERRGSATSHPALPYGSEGVRSPTYVAPATTVLSPQPVKPGSPTGSMRNLLRSEPEVSPPATAYSTAGTYEEPHYRDPGAVAYSTAGTYEEPSYRGPGAAFEKGEDVPRSEAPAPPTEEELDVLET